MYSTHVGYIPHPWLPRAARRAFIFDDVTANLFSYAQIVKHGCTVLLEDRGVTIADAATKKVLDFQAKCASDNVFMHRWSKQDKRLMFQARQQQMNEQLNSSNDEPVDSTNPACGFTLIHNLPMYEKARFFEDIFCGTPKSTIIKAAKKGWLRTWYGLNARLLGHTPHNTPAQAAGHLDRTRKSRPHRPGQTRASVPDELDGSDDDDCGQTDRVEVAFIARGDKLYDAEHTVFMDEPATMRDIDKTALTNTLIVSLNGYVRVEPMASGTGAEMVKAYKRAIAFFKANGKGVRFTVLDNKCPQVLRDEFKALGIQFQHVPPGQHQYNKSERYIRFYKNKVISAKAIAGADFDMARNTASTSPQIEVVMNVVRACTTDPTMSAYKWMHGHDFDYGSTPLLPLGLKVTVYDQPKTQPRGAWGPHGQIGHVVGFCPDHYRCYLVLMARTGKTRITNTLEFHPTDVILPGASQADQVVTALRELSSAIKGSTEADLAGQDMDEEDKQQLRDLHAVFSKRTTPPPAQADKADTPRTPPSTERPPVPAPSAARQRVAGSEGATATPQKTASALDVRQRVAGTEGGAREAPQQAATPPAVSPGSTIIARKPAQGTKTPTSARSEEELPSAMRGDWPRGQTPAPTSTAGEPRGVMTRGKSAGANTVRPTNDNEVELSHAISRKDWLPGQTSAIPPTTAPSSAAPSPRKTVHWTGATDAPTPASPTPPAEPPRLGRSNNRRSNRNRRPSAKASARVATNATTAAAKIPSPPAYTVEDVEDDSDDEGDEDAAAATADAMLQAAADRDDPEALLMRAEGNDHGYGRLHAAVQSSLHELVMAEYRADIAMNTFTHPCDPRQRELRRQAFEAKQTAIGKAPQIAALLRPAIDYYDESDDYGDRTDVRELHPDDTPESDGIAFGTVDDATGQAINLRQESKPGHVKAPGWCQARVEELERLLVTTDCIEPMALGERPREGATVSYIAWAASYKYDSAMNPLFRIRGAYGGNVLKNKYVGETAAATASLPAFKILLNAVLSTPGAKFMTIDLKDMYLQSILEQEEYVAVPVSEIPDASMTRHNLRDKIRNGRVYFRVNKAMYGLPQAGYIAQQDLGTLLRANGFYECPRTPQVFRHETRNLTMSIVVDDFGVLYLKKEDVDWLLDVLRTKYELKVDWDGKLYIGITLQWDYKARTCRMSMPDYVRKGVSRFLGESAATSLRHGPAQYKQFAYGHQTAPEQDETAPLSKDRIKRVQAIVGYFLYYARAVDPTMLVALGQIASSQTRATENVEAACTHFLHYAATYPNATIVYRSSDMFLRLVTDASFFSELDPNGMGTRMGGTHMLGDIDDATRLNGMIDTLCKLIDVVPASVAEAELASTFYNMKMAAETRLTLEDFGFPQPPTPVECDNQCAVGIANQSVKLKRSRAMDVRFHWVADRVKQGQFVIVWKKGSQNLADYFTKIHPPAHHRAQRSKFVCDEPLTGRTTAEMRRKTKPRNLTQQVANYVKYVYNVIADTAFRR